MMDIAAFPQPLRTGPDLVSLRERLADALGPAAGVACTGVDGDPRRLWPEEQAAIRRAIPRRQREYAAGRSAAREAIARMGWPPSAIASAPDRSPIWPTGLVGSIAHTGRVCVAVAGQREQVHAMGIDMEDDQPLDTNLWNTICTAEEMAVVMSLPPSERGRWVTRSFCAKEAYYKWQYPQTGRMLDFHDVQIVIDPRADRFSVRSSGGAPAALPVCRRDGQFLITQGLVLAWVIGAPA